MAADPKVYASIAAAGKDPFTQQTEPLLPRTSTAQAIDIRVPRQEQQHVVGRIERCRLEQQRSVPRVKRVRAHAAVQESGKCFAIGRLHRHVQRRAEFRIDLLGVGASPD